MKGRKIELAKGCLDTFGKCFIDRCVKLISVDVSLADAQSYGVRQVVVELKHFAVTNPILIRLSGNNMLQDVQKLVSIFKNWQTIQDQSTPDDKSFIIIDLRIPQLAFVKKN